MNLKQHQNLPHSKSYHHLSHYYQPMSPISKIATPHKINKNAFNNSIGTTPINFSSALHNFKSLNNQENISNSSNQSPIMSRFNIDNGTISNERNRSPLLMVDKRMKKTKQIHNKSQVLDQDGSQNKQIQFHNFEASLMSLAKSPKMEAKSIMKCRNNQSKLKGILQTQQYQISIENKSQTQKLRKTSSANQYTTKLINKCSKKSDQSIQCVNNDGNIAKYMTVLQEEDDMRLYYCSKCTVLLVSQGFILQEIKIKQHLPKKQLSEEILAACKDKLKSLINDLQMRQSFQLNQINHFYQQLTNILHSQMSNTQQIIKAAYQQKVQNYQEILSTLRSNKSKQYEKYHHLILQERLGEHLLNKYQSNQLQKLYQDFRKIVHQKFNLIINQTERIKQSSKEIPLNPNNGLRFSFEKLLHDINNNKSKVQNIINTLEEQQSVQNNSRLNNKRDNRKTAFRDLFPQSEQSVQASCGVNSPTFKHF